MFTTISALLQNAARRLFGHTGWIVMVVTATLLGSARPAEATQAIQVAGSIRGPADPAEVEKYDASPWTGFICTAGFYRDLMSGLSRIHKLNFAGTYPFETGDISEEQVGPLVSCCPPCKADSKGLRRQQHARIGVFVYRSLRAFVADRKPFSYERDEKPFKRLVH